jgi:hypothetical protein
MSSNFPSLQRACRYAGSPQYGRRRIIRVMPTPKPSNEVRTYLAAIGAKGGKSFTEKKKVQLSKIQSKGGKTVTPKKLAHLRKMTAERVARQKAERGKK